MIVTTWTFLVRTPPRGGGGIQRGGVPRPPHGVERDMVPPITGLCNMSPSNGGIPSMDRTILVDATLAGKGVCMRDPHPAAVATPNQAAASPGDASSACNQGAEREKCQGSAFPSLLPGPAKEGGHASPRCHPLFQHASPPHHPPLGRTHPHLPATSVCILPGRTKQPARISRNGSWKPPARHVMGRTSRGQV